MCSGAEWIAIERSADIGVEAVGFSCGACGFIRMHRRDL
jgi:hypothetical protein